MAIDRPTIIKQIFNGTREPATGWVSPVVDGYKADACGESCEFDPAKAKAKLDEAGGFKGGKMTISYNADASHKAWVEATCNSHQERPRCRLCRHPGRRLRDLPQPDHATGR